MLFLPACSCAFGGWDGEDGKEKEEGGGGRIILMAESPWNNWHLSKAASPRPPARLHGHRRLPICSARTHTHTAQHKQQNDFPTTLLTSATLLPSLAPCAFSSPPASPGFASQQAGQVPVVKSPFNHSLLFRNAKP